MEKITLDGLPVLTDQTEKEILSLSMANTQIENLWKERFLENNFELYNSSVVFLSGIYPKFSDEINSEFAVSYEMLRRQAEIYKIIPELPHASMDAISYINKEILKGSNIRPRHIEEIISENPIYSAWAL